MQQLQYIQLAAKIMPFGNAELLSTPMKIEGEIRERDEQSINTTTYSKVLNLIKLSVTVM